MNDSPDVQGHHGPTSRPGATDDTVAAETLAATPFPATEQIDQADATGPVDDMVPFSGADDAADLSGDREERWWRRLPLLAFAIAALAALVALASAGVVLTSTSRTDAPHDVQSVAGSRHDDAVCSADAGDHAGVTEPDRATDDDAVPQGSVRTRADTGPGAVESLSAAAVSLAAPGRLSTRRTAR